MTAEHHRRPDSGFTLIELLVVVVVLGFVVSALAAAFVVVVKATPGNEARADDSRALLSLTTWLSKDVASTAENGFAVGGATSGCAGVPASTGLLELRWQEGATTYVTNYRYVSTGANTGRIHRYACKLGQPANDLRLTPDLRNVTTGTLAPAPVAITLVPTTMANGNPGHKGLQFVVTVFDDNGVQRELLSLDATTTNVVSTLPPSGGGPGSSNRPPEAGPGTTSVTVGQSVEYDLPVTEPDGDSLSTTFTGVPAGWNVTAIGTRVTITPELGTLPGTYTIGYTVTDPGSLSASNVVDVLVSLPDTNQPPVAPAITTTATRGVPVTIPVNATDPEDGTGVTIDVPSPPAGWNVQVIGRDVTITPPSGATGSTIIEYTATDSAGLVATSTITVQVCTVTITDVDPSSVKVHTNGQVTGNLQRDVTVAISTNSACQGALVLTFKPKEADAVETSLEFGTATTVVIVKDAYVWDTVARGVNLQVRQGANGVVEASRTLNVTT